MADLMPRQLRARLSLTPERIRELRGVLPTASHGWERELGLALADIETLIAWIKRPPETVLGQAFSGWESEDFIDQLEAQARDQLDPEYSAFLRATADHLRGLIPAPTIDGVSAPQPDAIEAAVLAEREACVQVADEHAATDVFTTLEDGRDHSEGSRLCARSIAAMLRSRSILEGGDRVEDQSSTKKAAYSPAPLSPLTSPSGAVPDAAVAEDWRDDPSADERWNAGCDYAMTQLCGVLGVDPQSVNWDAATETLDGDVRAVLCNILRAHLGEDWDFKKVAPSPMAGAIAVVEGLRAEYQSKKTQRAITDDDPLDFVDVAAIQGVRVCNRILESLHQAQPSTERQAIADVRNAALEEALEIAVEVADRRYEEHLAGKPTDAHSTARHIARRIRARRDANGSRAPVEGGAE